jgi:hypothetical protein
MARVLGVHFFEGIPGNPFVDPRTELNEKDISSAIVRVSRTQGMTLDVDFLSKDDATQASDGERASAPTPKLWYLFVVYELESGPPQQYLLFVGSPANQRSYSRREADDRHRVRFICPLAAMQRLSVRPAPPERPDINVHLDTNLQDEFLRFGVSADGFPDIAIPRIEYSPDATVWDTLSPYVTPFEPLVISAVTDSDSDTGFYEEDDRTLLGSASVGYRLTPVAEALSGVQAVFGSGAGFFEIDYHQIAETSADVSGERVNCVKLLIAPPPALGISPDVEYDERREEGDPSPGEDGRSIITGEIWWDLHEDPEDEEKVTRSVFMGQFSRTHDVPAEDAALGAQMAGSETVFTYEDDYQRLTRVRTATAAQVDLPGIGRSILMPDAWIEVEDTDWQPDPDEPGAYFLKKKTRSESGIVIVVNDDAGNPIFSSGIDAISATRSRVVDVSATSSQRHLDHLIRRTVEDYHATGEDTMSFLTTHYDALRGVSFPGRGGQGIQRSSVRPVPAVIVEYLTDYRDDLSGFEKPLVATVIDTTHIGYEHGVDLAEGLFAADEHPEALIASPLIWLEPKKFRHGTAWRVAGMTEDMEEIDGGETGVAVITGITYEFQIEPDLVATQTLELMRPSGVAK